ncbi:MAG: NYN domain-containing protein [bacterium]|nr:NYN domain-containing protein [bacterium]
MNIQQRVGVFIDIQNLYYSAKALYNQKVDFGKVLEVAVGDRTLVRAIAYVIRAEHSAEQSFFDSLKKRGLEVRAKELQTFYDGNKKGDWDVGIAMDVMRLADKLDVISVVSGDGDFAPLLEHVKSLGCRAEAVAFGPSSSIQLREEADQFIDLAELKDNILIGTARPQKPRVQQKRAQPRPVGRSPKK